MNPLKRLDDLKGEKNLDCIKEHDEDQDIDFIEEIVKGYREDLDLEDQIYTIVRNALEDKNNLSSDDKEDILTSVEAHQDRFDKVMSYTSLLLE